MKYYYLFLFIILLFGCDKKDIAVSSKNNRPDKPDSVYFDKLVHMECLPASATLDSLQRYIGDFQTVESRQRSIYYLLKTKWHRIQGEKDSTLFYFDKLTINEGDVELKILKFLEELYIDYQSSAAVAYDKSARIFSNIKFAEQRNSLFTFRLYRELAEAYYLNGKQRESSHFNDLWFKNTPNKKSLWVQDSYYSNQFVIAHQLERVDSMKIYLDKVEKVANQLNNERVTAKFHNYEAQYHYYAKNYEAALESSKKFFNYYKKIDNLAYDNYHNLALAFLDNKELDSALYYFKKAYVVSKENKEEINGELYFKMLAEVYDKQGDFKNASIAKDSVQKHYYAFQEKVQNDKLEELKIQYDTEKKDIKINNLQSTNKLHKMLLVGGAFLVISVGSILYMIYKRRFLKAKNEKLEIENKKLNIEQKVLQLQLNPHFVYNSIANLQGLISQGETTKSVNYLSSFSKLLRNILELNREDFIPLKDEIASVTNYMKLQQMRFEGLFDYEINLPEDYNTEFIMIPPMLLQPFLENSIEHGFKNINYKGKIEISFAITDKKLIVEIEDNGTGMSNSKTENPNKKSLSKIIIQERLDILFNQKSKESYLEISSINQDEKTGVSVKIILPLIED
ncbi:Histidine kinase [Paenimyroides ummariense]|uniref:Histidine kinase n=1 Tax=Paenimyroides ummariense TaxID=913024 RepID=A0A1I4W212_9FLAO|nr:histidine kinase [Paenimyroides ummariense]SFN07598.1 Histidine kinase [Paenimyroides ummariense]